MLSLKLDFIWHPATPDNNNKIVIATAAQDLGLNDGIKCNANPTLTNTASTRNYNKTIFAWSFIHISTRRPNLGQKELTPMPGVYKHSDKHEKKTVIIIGSIVICGVAITIYKVT